MKTLFTFCLSCFLLISGSVFAQNPSITIDGETNPCPENDTYIQITNSNPTGCVIDNVTLNYSGSTIQVVTAGSIYVVRWLYTSFNGGQQTLTVNSHCGSTFYVNQFTVTVKPISPKLVDDNGK